MNYQEMILGMMRRQGRSDAADLRARAAKLDGTAIIAEENKIPAFDPEKDYSSWPAGAPVEDGGQIYTLLQPHNAADHPGSRPSNTPALWSITHTKDPAKAKAYLPPDGTSGLYMLGEVCLAAGHVWKSRIDNNAWAPGAEGAETAWEDLGAATV